MENIYTKLLILRPYTLQDITEVHRYLSDKEVTRYMILGPFQNEEETSHYLTQILATYKQVPERTFEYAIEWNGKLIGGCSIEVDETGTKAELGWVLHPDYQKQGFMQEAAKAIKDYATLILGVSYIYARCDEHNFASQRLMNKIGLSKEKVIPYARVNKNNGKYEHAECIFSNLYTG